MKACSKGTAAAACLGYALITAALFWASPYIRPEPSTGVFLAAFSTASLWACKRLSVRGWLRGRALAGLLAAALYASFASFGYRLFLSGERMQFSAGRVGMLLLGVVCLCRCCWPCWDWSSAPAYAWRHAPNRPAASCDGLSHGSGP